MKSASIPQHEAEESQSLHSLTVVYQPRNIMKRAAESTREENS